MIAAAKSLLLRLLRVPPEPSPPAGSEESLRIFRAAPNYLRYRLVLWGLAQVGSLVGLIVFDGILLNRLRDDVSGNLYLGLVALLVLAIVGFVVSFVVTGLLVLLDYEQRWYLVTDDSLRIREGIRQVREMTMTFANIQNISLEQGPLQRILGVADLKVQSAGGGGAGSSGHESSSGLDMHTGFFRGVDNAEQLRDLMRDRLRRAKGPGLGDPDDLASSSVDARTAESRAGDAPTPPWSDPSLADAVLAELGAEARQLRRTVEQWAARV